MKKAIIYTGPAAEIQVPKARATFKRKGDPIEIDGAIADKLIEQAPDDWKAGVIKPAKKIQPSE